MTVFNDNEHYSKNMESGILGVSIIEPQRFAIIYPLLSEDIFYLEHNKAVFRALKELFDKSLPIDLFTVIDTVVRRHRHLFLNDMEAPVYITNLTRDVVSSAHVEFWAFTVKTMWMEREVINLTSSGSDSGFDVRQRIQDLQVRLLNINGKATRSDWEDMTQLMVKIYQHQEKLKLNDGMGIRTGWRFIDRNYGGLFPGSSIVIASRPSVGKSAFAAGLAVEIAKLGTPVGIQSLEMPAIEVASRIVSYDLDEYFNTIFRGVYRDDQEREEIYQKIGRSTINLPIYVNDQATVTTLEIRAGVARLAKKGAKVIIIDYLQLVTSDKSVKQNREQEVSAISRECKIMAKEEDVVVILLAQLSREVTKRTGDNRYPVLQDLRESGSIEQDADAVIFLHRDSMSGIEVDEEGLSTRNQANVVIRKWRNGQPNRIIDLDFDGEKMKFSEKPVIEPFTYTMRASLPYKDEDPF